MCLDRTSTSFYLVRHAEAGERTDRPDDHLRPLTGAGRHQARSLATKRAGDGLSVVEVLAAPATCLSIAGADVESWGIK